MVNFILSVLSQLLAQLLFTYLMYLIHKNKKNRP